MIFNFKNIKNIKKILEELSHSTEKYWIQLIAHKFEDILYLTHYPTLDIQWTQELCIRLLKIRIAVFKKVVIVQDDPSTKSKRDFLVAKCRLCAFPARVPRSR